MSEPAAPSLISPAAAVAMVVVGVFAFCALLVLMTYASALENGDNGGGHALSKSAIGFSGLAEGLRGLGEPVLISRHLLPRNRRAGVYVLTPPLQAADKNVTPMGFAGPVLVVMPKWAAAPDPKHHGWVAVGEPAPPEFFGKASLISKAKVSRRKGVAPVMLTSRGGPFPPGQTFAFGPTDALQTMDLSAWKGWTPVLVDKRGATVMAKAPYGPDYLLSDPDLLDNQGLKNLTTFSSAATMIGALRAEDGPVIFDVTLNGLGLEKSALNLMFDPPFLGVTLCLAAAAALAGFQAFCRFGPARRETRALAHGKQALVDNTAALVRMAGREAAMGEPYATLTRELAARAVGAPRNLTGEALTAFLDRVGARRHAADTVGVLSLLARAAANPNRLLATARRLYRWRVEMTGEG
ncbi:MAG: hypothetical protein ACREEB_14750 [Caulobacteraceae bacterium]